MSTPTGDVGQHMTQLLQNKNAGINGAGGEVGGGASPVRTGQLVEKGPEG
jgi:hypothetical protein